MCDQNGFQLEPSRCYAERLVDARDGLCGVEDRISPAPASAWAWDASNRQGETNSAACLV